MLDFGFPELLVKDLDHPLDSLRDATIKCWYSDDAYKAMIVSGTGVEQGKDLTIRIAACDKSGAKEKARKQLVIHVE